MKYQNLLIVCMVGITFLGCNTNKPPATSPIVAKSHFGNMPDGTEISRYMLSNNNDISVGILNYGGIIQSINIPDAEGNLHDVVLGFNELRKYIEDSPHFGCITGRYANRIAKGKFTLEGKDYQLDLNNGPNHLHGGFKGFDKQVWDAKTFRNDTVAGVRLSFLSPDGDQGYPGNLDVTVTYSLNNDNELRIDYKATTDKTTVVNLTNHSYFNLDDGGASDILDHQLKLIADAFTPTDETLIPTGEIRPVDNSPMDFSAFKPIGRDIYANYKPLKVAGGYDHNYVLNRNNGEMQLAAIVKEPDNGRKMEVYTTEPGIQLYTGNFLDGSITGKNGNVYKQRHGFCLETQHFPDSPNQPEFPSTVLQPGDTYSTSTIYKFHK